MIDIQKEAEAISKEVIGFRRYFHQHPEPGMQEYVTSAGIREALDQMGIPWRLYGETGISADIGRGKKMIALRADMDALAVTEKTGVPYASKTPGMMHACGHDAHIAALLGAAKILKAHEDELTVTVRCIFQPSEENCLGAKMMCEEGALDGVSEIYGIHIFTDIPAGMISVEPGARMASTSSLQVTIRGQSGHGAKPQQCVDATVAGAAAVMNLQSIISREIDPVDSAVVTVGHFTSGSQYNIISGEAFFEGTVRAFSQDTAQQIEAALRRVVSSTAQAYRAKAHVDFAKALHPVVINDEALTAKVHDSAEAFFGKDRMIHVPPMMIGEDFSVYQAKIPGVFMFVGGRNPIIGCGYPNHHECFNIDERVLTDCVMLHLLAVTSAQTSGGNYD